MIPVEGAAEAVSLARDIDRALCRSPGGGLYRVEVERENGTSAAYYVSWSTGMAYSAYQGGYERKFCRDLPAWLKEEHPSYAFTLCKLALERETPLPSTIPLPVGLLE